jgi:hypothetical protein
MVSIWVGGETSAPRSPLQEKKARLVTSTCLPDSAQSKPSTPSIFHSKRPSLQSFLIQIVPISSSRDKSCATQPCIASCRFSQLIPSTTPGSSIALRRSMAIRTTTSMANQRLEASKPLSSWWVRLSPLLISNQPADVHAALLLLLHCNLADGDLHLQIHGWPDCSAGWRFQIPALLGMGFRVVAPDLMG